MSYLSTRYYIVLILGAGGKISGLFVGDTPTLGRGAATLGRGGNSGLGVSAVFCWVSMWSWKMLASYSRVTRLLSVIGAISVAGDIFWRTAASIALSFDLGMGMTKLVGRQYSVSLTHSTLILQTHTHLEVDTIQHYLHI